MEEEKALKQLRRTMVPHARPMPKVVHEKKVLEVIVEKGMQNGQKITFPWEVLVPDVSSNDWKS